MKTVIMALMLIGVVATAGAQETSVQVAEEKFEVFHEVMHPAWHDAYPAKDYAALIASGPKFEATFLPIAKLEPAIKNSARLDKFKSFRKEMGLLTAAYADACRKSDSAKVYELLPDLHMAFEEAMWELQPMEFKPLDGLLITADVILDIHIPGDNWDGMAGSTETMVMKLGHITDEIYPPELSPVKKEMNAEFDKARAAVGEMMTCADKKDLAGFRAKATELKEVLLAMRENYL